MSGVDATLPAAIVDSSALMSILQGEAAAPLFMAGFQSTDKLYIGAATRAETWLAAFNAKGLAGAQLVEALLMALQVETVAFTPDSLPQFIDGAQNHHHKVDPKARLNLGDLFTYALARDMGLPLFFQGTDFTHTSVENAMMRLGYALSDKGVPLPKQDSRIEQEQK